MTREEAVKALDGVAEAMSAQHPGQPERLHQVTSHLSTAAMAIGHLFDHSENTMAEAEGTG
jgi:hypothetical protein